MASSGAHKPVVFMRKKMMQCIGLDCKEVFLTTAGKRLCPKCRKNFGSGGRPKMSKYVTGAMKDEY